MWYCYAYRVSEAHHTLSSTIMMAFAFGTYEDMSGDLSDQGFLLFGEMDPEERGNLAYALFLIDRDLQSAVGLPSSFPDSYVTDPRSWPNSSPLPKIVGDCCMDLTVRAVLFRDAILKFINQSKDGLTDASWGSFESLRSALVEFGHSLPPLDDERGADIVEMPSILFYAVNPALLHLYLTTHASMMLLCDAAPGERTGFFTNVLEAAQDMAALVRRARGPQSELPLNYCNLYTIHHLWVGCEVLLRYMKANHPASTLDKYTRLNNARRDLSSLLDLAIDVIRLFPAWAPVMKMLLAHLEEQPPSLPMILR